MGSSPIRRYLNPTPLAVGLAMSCNAFPALADETPDPASHHLKTDSSTAQTDAKNSASLANGKGKGPKTIKQADGTEVEQWTVVASPMNTLRSSIGRAFLFNLSASY